MMRAPLHPGTFVAGLLFFMIGCAFTLEELGVWDVKLGDLWFVGPLAMILAGAAIIAVGTWHREPPAVEDDDDLVSDVVTDVGSG